MKTGRMLSLVLATAATWAADAVAPGPWALRAGWAEGNAQLRQFARRDGWYLGGGVILPQRGLVSRMGVDADWRSARGEGHYDAISVMYAERVAISNGVYAGAGVGAGVVRLTTPQWATLTIGPAGKALVGWMPAWRTAWHQRVALEGTWFATDRVHGVRSDGITVGAVLGF